MAHLRTHYKIKPYICNYCSKSFNEKGNLKTHIRIHTGERPFKCQKCQKSFKALGQLKDHFISHTGLKPFQCPYCKKYYRRKEILKNHFEIHRKESFFVNNEEKFKEIMDHINRMKNKVLSFNDNNIVNKKIKENLNSNNVNNINSTSSGSETNLSCSVSSNDDSKQSISNNSDKDKNNNIKALKEEKDKSQEYAYLDKNNDLKDQINFIFSFNNKLNSDIFCSNNNIDFDKSKYPELIINNTLNANLNEENNNILFFNDRIESKEFSFHELFDIDEKEIKVSSKIEENNDINLSEEKIEKDFENYDCCSKITNLYFQVYQPQIDNI